MCTTLTVNHNFRGAFFSHFANAGTPWSIHRQSPLIGVCVFFDWRITNVRHHTRSPLQNAG